MKRWIETIATSAIVLLAASNAYAQKKPAAKEEPKADDKAGAAVASGAPVGQSTQAGWLKANPGECISSEAKKALSACPGGNIKKSSGKKSGPTFMETDVGQSKKADKTINKPVEISIDRPAP